jgi:hypothetical protein
MMNPPIIVSRGPEPEENGPDNITTELPSLPTMSGNTKEKVINDSKINDSAKQDRTWHFWAVFPTLMVTTLLSAVEVSVTSTAMPTIVHDLNIGNNYAWIVNSFLLTRWASLNLAASGHL